MFEVTWKDDMKFSALTEVRPLQIEDTKKILKVAPLYWSEHCVECALPECYKTCKLYNPREDGKCARFSYGIFPNSSFSGHYQYGLDINFERWAKLEAYWPKKPTMVSIRFSRFEQKALKKFNSLGAYLSKNIKLDKNKKISNLFSWVTEIWNRLRINGLFKNSPNALYMKFYSPSKNERSLELEIEGDRPFFRKKILIYPGWNELSIDFADLSTKFKGIGRIRLWPSDDKSIRLIFTWLDLVNYNKQAKLKSSVNQPKKVKCVCWDLDNTLWSGVIGDDLGENVFLKSGVVSIIEEFDRRGIVQSIVSKNNYDTAWKKIEELRLDKYFLYPAINWGLKSESIKSIASELNIGLESIAVIDDSVWERDEITNHLPMIRVFDPEELGTLLSKDDFNVLISKESKMRRKMYQQESARKSISESWGSNFEGFLESCDMKMEIFHPNNSSHFDRSLELLQRTNQFNLSGRLYDKKTFEKFLVETDFLHFCVKVNDKFGDYGIVLFGSLKPINNSLVLEELVMSCRVAQKMVEKTFIYWCANYAKNLNKASLDINMNITNKNKPLQEALKSIDIIDSLDKRAEGKRLSINLNQKISVPKIIKIVTSEH